MKDKIRDMIGALIHIAMVILGWIIVFRIFIPTVCDILYPIFGLNVATCITVIVSWFVITSLIMYTFLIAEMFFKK